jgi:hypothetical protein
MKDNRQELLIPSFVIAILVICFAAGILSAHEPERKGRTFSLPSETRWGNVVLPAGDYSFSLGTAGDFYTVTVMRNGMETVARIIPLPPEERKSPAKSQLLLVREGKKATVHILYLADIGTEFHFKVPDSYEVYTRLMARAFGPIVVERIPVIVSGK